MGKKRAELPRFILELVPLFLPKDKDNLSRMLGLI